MAVSSAASAVQVAVYARLASDAPLVALVDRIGDSVPEGAAVRAYVVLSVVSEVRDRRLATGAGGNAALLLVSVASHVEDTQQRTGGKAVQEITRRVIERLDNAELVIDGWTFVSCDFDASVAQQDGAWRTMTADFQILVEDT